MVAKGNSAAYIATHSRDLWACPHHVKILKFAGAKIASGMTFASNVTRIHNLSLAKGTFWNC